MSLLALWMEVVLLFSGFRHLVLWTILRTFLQSYYYMSGRNKSTRNRLYEKKKKKQGNERKIFKNVQFCIMPGFSLGKFQTKIFHLRLFWNRALGENTVANSEIYL